MSRGEGECRHQEGDKTPERRSLHYRNKGEKAMKTVKKLGISGSMLTAAKDAEASLARQEAQDLEKGIPEGHPLREEAEKMKAMLGDLGGLPPGHPLLLQMQAAKARYEQQQVQKAEEQDRVIEVRKAKKIDASRVRQDARRAEDEQSEVINGAAKRVNNSIDDTLTSVRELYKTMSDNAEILNNDPIGRAKVSRLKRLLFAAERGLSELKITKAGV